MPNVQNHSPIPKDEKDLVPNRAGSSKRFPVVVVAGPTASGKSQLALELAESSNGEIVNYDSVQIFRRLDIGASKPPDSDRRRVPHHLIDIREPGEDFSAGDYQRLARSTLGEVSGRGKLPVMVGGSGFYLRAVTEGLFAGPQRSEHWRSRLEQRADARGREYLHRLLVRLDPRAAARIAPRDKPKVIRALEVRLETGRSLSDHLEIEPRRPATNFEFCLIGLDPPRAALYERIDRRVDRMIEEGLVAEVRRLVDDGVRRGSGVFLAIGYRHILAHLDGVHPLDEAIILIKRDTRRYAKRQISWFKKQHAICWFDGFGDDETTIERIRRYLDSNLGSVAR